jgi:two-component system, NarL family, nitrate/nitrite response regulator NarL
MKPISIYIADDHTLMLEAMGTLVESIAELRLLGKFSSGKALLEGFANAELKPDVILMDIEMPDIDGVETTKNIRKLDSSVKIIALTMHQESHFISKMIAAGANGYLIKNVDRQVFLNSITKVLTTNTFVVEGAQQKSDSQIESILSQREIEILKEIVKGKTNKEIGEQFFISDRTVDTHRTNIKRKLKFNSLAQLIEYAKNNGIQ